MSASAAAYAEDWYEDWYERSHGAMRAPAWHDAAEDALDALSIAHLVERPEPGIHNAVIVYRRAPGGVYVEVSRVDRDEYAGDEGAAADLQALCERIDEGDL